MSKPVAYTEEQARHWLWFLARNMQSHGQSMFMLEQLQPGWLLAKWQVFAYLLLSRAVMYGALALLFGGTVLFVHIVDSQLDAPNPVRLDRVSLACIAILCILSPAVEILYAVLSSARTSAGLPGWLKAPARFLCLVLRFTLMPVIVRPAQWVLRRGGRSLDGDIQTVERLSWSWINFLKGLIFLTVRKPWRNLNPLLKWPVVVAVWSVRILCFVFLALLAYLIVFQTSDIHLSAAEKVTGILFFFLANLLWGFFSAIQTASVELKTAPNLGVLLTGRNALFPFAFDLVAGCSVAFYYWKSEDVDGGGLGLIVAIVLIAGVFFWARLGGLDFLAHYCLRFVLWRCGYAPLSYARFLNYAATELGFLQKAGGGYVFMHRYLQEYFAGSEQPPHVAQNAVADAPAALH